MNQLTKEMPQTIAHITVLVRDYDEAITFFTQSSGFDLIEDTPSNDRQGRAKRWVLIAPPGSRGTRILLAKASSGEEATRIGNQTGGRVFLFLHTDDFWRDYNAMEKRGEVHQGTETRRIWNSSGFRRPVRKQMGPVGVEEMTLI